MGNDNWIGWLGSTSLKTKKLGTTDYDFTFTSSDDILTGVSGDYNQGIRLDSEHFMLRDFKDYTNVSTGYFRTSVLRMGFDEIPFYQIKNPNNPILQDQTDGVAGPSARTGTPGIYSNTNGTKWDTLMKDETTNIIRAIGVFNQGSTPRYGIMFIKP